MSDATLKNKYTTITLNKDADQNDKNYHGYIVVEFDFQNEMSPIGQFFAVSQEGRIFKAIKRLFGENSQYSNEDWSIMVTVADESCFEMAAKLGYEIRAIEADFDLQLEKGE